MWDDAEINRYSVGSDGKIVTPIILDYVLGGDQTSNTFITVCFQTASIDPQNFTIHREDSYWPLEALRSVI